MILENACWLISCPKSCPIFVSIFLLDYNLSMD